MNSENNSIILVHDLVKKFGNFTAVDHISFEVQKGEMVAFLGPNGAGKTTTIKMLTTLLHPTSGSILLNGSDPVRHQHEARKSFGIVFQDPSLDDDLTVMENMRFHAVLYKIPSPLKEQRTEQMLKFVDLWDRKDSLVKTFSGGMKRRLEIARALLHHPEIIFLDEPTLGLDPQTRNHVWSYIQTINKEEGMTVFFTTHYMEEAEKIAQRIAVIDHGRIIAVGTPETLKSKTNTKSLEEAFLALTGKIIREEEGSNLDNFRKMAKLWRRKT